MQLLQLSTVVKKKKKKLAMIDKNITMQDIHDKITAEYPNDLHCIYSDDNDEKLILRIRIMNDEENNTQDEQLSK